VDPADGVKLEEGDDEYEGGRSLASREGPSLILVASSMMLRDDDAERC